MTTLTRKQSRMLSSARQRGQSDAPAVLDQVDVYADELPHHTTQLDIYEAAGLTRPEAFTLETHAAKIITIGRRSYIDIGRELLAARELAQHGTWRTFLQRCGMSESTARNYMNVAERFADKSTTVALLPPAALYAMSAPNADPTVVDAIVSEVDAGSTLTTPEIKERLAPKSIFDDAAFVDAQQRFATLSWKLVRHGVWYKLSNAKGQHYATTPDLAPQLRTLEAIEAKPKISEVAPPAPRAIVCSQCGGPWSGEGRSVGPGDGKPMYLCATCNGVTGLPQRTLPPDFADAQKRAKKLGFWIDAKASGVYGLHYEGTNDAAGGAVDWSSLLDLLVQKEAQGVPAPADPPVRSATCTRCGAERTMTRSLTTYEAGLVPEYPDRRVNLCSVCIPQLLAARRITPPAPATLTRPRRPADQGVSAILEYQRALETYIFALEEMIPRTPQDALAIANRLIGDDLTVWADRLDDRTYEALAAYRRERSVPLESEATI
jgi:Protein of unknown function (DUF3102)